MNRPGRGQRQIIKQGYLKKVSNSHKLTRTFKRPERRWVVFGILGGHEPYLEYYSSEEGVFTAPPLTYISLLTCKHVSHVFISGKYNNNFTIITNDKVIDLIAPSRNVMVDWCSTIERKLKSLHILTDSKENDYEISRVPRRAGADTSSESVIQVSRDYSQPLDSQDTERPRTSTPSSIPTSPAPLPPEGGTAGAVFFGDSSSLPNSPAPAPPSNNSEQVFFSEADLNQPPVVPPRPATTFSSPPTSEESLFSQITPPPPPRSSGSSSSARSSGASIDRPWSSDTVSIEVFGLAQVAKLEATDSLRPGRPGRDPKSPLPPPPLATKKNRRPPPPLPVQRPLSSPVLPPLPPLPVDRHPESSATLSRIDDLRKRPLPPPPLPEKSETIRRRSQLLLRSDSWESSSDSSPRGSSIFASPARDSHSSSGSSDDVETCHLDSRLDRLSGAATSPASASASASPKTSKVINKVADSYASVNKKSSTLPSKTAADPTQSPDQSLIPDLQSRAVTQSLDFTQSPQARRGSSPFRPTPAPRTKKPPHLGTQPVTSPSDACLTHNLPHDKDSSSDRIPREIGKPAETNIVSEKVGQNLSECPELYDSVRTVTSRDQSCSTAAKSNECDQTNKQSIEQPDRPVNEQFSLLVDVNVSATGSDSDSDSEIVYETPPKAVKSIFDSNRNPLNPQQSLVIPACTSSTSTSSNHTDVANTNIANTDTFSAALDSSDTLESNSALSVTLSTSLTAHSIDQKSNSQSLLVDLSPSEDNLKNQKVVEPASGNLLVDLGTVEDSQSKVDTKLVSSGDTDTSLLDFSLSETSQSNKKHHDIRSTIAPELRLSEDIDNLIDFDVNENNLKVTLNQETLSQDTNTEDTNNQDTGDQDTKDTTMMNQEDTYQSLWNGASPISTARPTGRVVVSDAPNALAPPPVVPRRINQGTTQTSTSPPTPQSPPNQPRPSENGATSSPSRGLQIVTGRARPAGDEPSQQQQVNGVQFGARVPMGQPVFLCDEDENGEVSALTTSPPSQAPLRGFNRTSTTPSPPPAEPIPPLVAPVYPQTPDGARGATGGATYLPRPEVVRENNAAGALPPKMLEAMGLDDPEVGGWNQPPGEEGAPPPYLPRSVLERGTSKSLKESQVELLKKEMSHPGGVRVMLRRIDCHHTLALLDCCNGVWVGGWNQEARPFLHNAFHVGDKVISINGQVVENVKMANKLIKHCNQEDKITFILHRLPHGRVFALKREEVGQSLGIRRIGGTNEIEDVDPYGLAAKHGIPAKAPTLDGTNLCHWWITEVNNRPVSLFYKNNEVEHRLNAVGKDITILIQPTDLVQEFRTQLKLLKNYKDFVVQ